MRLLRNPIALYVVASAAFGLVSYQVVEYVYTEELDRVALLDLPDDPFNLLKQSVTIHDVSFIVWVLLCVAAALVVHRLTETLGRALETSEQRAGELALVGTLSAGLSGPLSPSEVAAAFLEGVRGVLPTSAAATLFQYEETAETIRILAQHGAGPLPRQGTSYALGALPAPMRTKLIGEHRAFVLDNTATDPDWPAFATAIPTLAGARSFAALPLVSRSRLIGALVLIDGLPDQMDRDRLQLVALLSQYVSGALHNALSIAEADSRADREAVVNRISQRRAEPRR